MAATIESNSDKDYYLSTQSPKSLELRDLMYDLIICGLPKDCALIGEILVSPIRKKDMTENRGKQIDAAEAALSQYVNKKVVAELRDLLDQQSKMPGMVEGEEDYNFVYSVTIQDRINSLTSTGGKNG